MTLNQTTKSKYLKNDLILLGVILIISLILLPLLNLNKAKDGAKAVITVDGKEYKTISLSEDTTFTVETEFGTNVITIKENEIYVEAADCPDKICVNHSHISHTGESIVCLPHRMIITIEGKEDSQIDGISQ